MLDTPKVKMSCHGTFNIGLRPEKSLENTVYPLLFGWMV